MQPLLGHGKKSIRHNHLQDSAWAEACVVRHFLKRGYTVCTNFSGHGPVDMIAMRTRFNKPAEILMIDVKMTSNRSYHGLTLEQKYAGVRIVTVDPDGYITLIPKGTERIKKEGKNDEDTE